MLTASDLHRQPHHVPPTPDYIRGNRWGGDCREETSMSAKMVQAGGDATIYRDTWGVPHIYGLDEERTLFGQGYAQAQDRLGTIYKAYRKANGRMSEAFGQNGSSMTTARGCWATWTCPGSGIMR